MSPQRLLLKAWSPGYCIMTPFLETGIIMMKGFFVNAWSYGVSLLNVLFGMGPLSL